MLMKKVMVSINRFDKTNSLVELSRDFIRDFISD